PDISDKEKDAIDNYVLDVFEELHNVDDTIKSIQEKKVDLDPKSTEFIKRILDTWAYKWKSEFNKIMNEATYTATWIAPDFELLKGNEPDLFTSSWCEMVHPSSKWRRQLVYGSNKKASRKCDGKQGELWRVCLAGKDKYLVEKIYKLEIPWKFEDDWFKLEDTCKMLLLIEDIICTGPMKSTGYRDLQILPVPCAFQYSSIKSGKDRGQANMPIPVPACPFEKI
ncbi:6134_t:CDS:2, partial [Entrophospora sp. SA101]